MTQESSDTEEYEDNSSEERNSKANNELNGETETKQNHGRRVKVIECLRGTAGTGDSSQDTPRIYGVGSRSLTSSASFPLQVLPDNGCTKSLVSHWMAMKYHIPTDRTRAEEFSLRIASGDMMEVTGVAKIYITPTGCRTK